MRLLAILHRSGVNAALVAGLLLMPAVILVGYWSEAQDHVGLAGFALRGSMPPDTSGGGPDAIPLEAGPAH